MDEPRPCSRSLVQSAAIFGAVSASAGALVAAAAYEPCDPEITRKKQRWIVTCISFGMARKGFPSSIKRAVIAPRR